MFRRRSPDHRPDIPPPKWFGGEFYTAAWEAFRAAHHSVRHAIVAFVAVLVVYAATGLPFPGLLLVAGVLVALAYRPPRKDPLPTDEELAELDAKRDQAEQNEHIASGRGTEMYERALSMLQSLLGQHVSVYGGGGGAAWRPLLGVSGILIGGSPDADPDGPVSLEGERLVFSIGNVGTFLLDRAQLEAPGASVHYDEESGLELVHADGQVLRILQESIDRA